ncbi:hypothetical protein BGW80DRAFT_1444897 [Lactifluus volemus]|nr:hypothetical protein BGW80DRAFT_1444897 [Lactifluus volemus]
MASCDMFTPSIKNLLSLCEIKRHKDNKAAVSSNIIDIVGQYPRFLKTHWKFLKTVIKLFEFMRETHDARSKIPLITVDLTPQQVHTFYEAVSYMISVQPNKLQKEKVIAKLMELPNVYLLPLLLPSSHLPADNATAHWHPHPLQPHSHPQGHPLYIALSFWRSFAFSLISINFSGSRATNPESKVPDDEVGISSETLIWAQSFHHETQPTASCSSSNFRSLFDAALKEYEKKTKEDLLTRSNKSISIGVEMRG